MAAMTSKFYYVCVIQYYSDQWANLVQTFYSYNTHKECEDSIKYKKYANVRSLVTTSVVFFTHPEPCTKISVAQTFGIN